MSVDGWERGDLLGVEFPIHVEALRDAGPEFLTRAFRAAGSLGADNRVVAVTELEPVAGGSTGRKASLTVAYERPGPELPERLFAKLSRDLDDERRDRGRWQMASEVRFGLLSQLPDFPVAVPRCLFGEHHLESGSALLISERIAFGEGGVEPQHHKARDHEVQDLPAHYDALVTALARLAGAHRAGRFPEDVMAQFAPRPTAPSAEPRPTITPDQVRERVDRYAAFAARHPQLLPASLRTDAFLARVREQAPRSIEHADALRAASRESAEGLVAFCHWNANIDNAWFWRDEGGDLACGLLDWGNVGQMNLVTALSSCLTFAEPDFLEEHLDRLLVCFVAAFEAAGGGPLDPAALQRQLALQMVSGGLAWPLGAVRAIERHGVDLSTAADRFDPRILDDEHLRTQLHLLVSYLTLWERSEPEARIDDAIRRHGGGR